MNRRLAAPEDNAPLIELDLAGTLIHANPAARARFKELSALGTLHPVLASVAGLLARYRLGERKAFSFEVAHEGAVYHQMVYFLAEESRVRVIFHDHTERRRPRG